MKDLLLTLEYLLLVAGSLGLLIAAAGLCRWTIHDAARRGKPPVLVLAAVLLFFPFGLIAWLLFRPPPARRSFRLQSRRVANAR